MAYSRSIQRAQTPKPCELCEVDITINWKCIDCRKLMCNKCKNIHAKFPAFRQHTIMDSKEHGDVLEDKMSIITDNIPCAIHKRKMTFMFCSSCNVLVCSECIASSHKQHNLDSIEKVCEEKLELVKTLRDKIAEDLTFYKSEAKKTEIDEAEKDSRFNETINNINKKEKKVKEAVSKYAQGLRDKVDMEREYMKKSMSDKQQKIKDVLRFLETDQDTLQKASRSYQGEDILNAAAYVHKTFYPKYKIYNETVSFIPRELTQSKVIDLFGILEDTQLPEEMYSDLELEKSYSTDFSYINRIVVFDDSRACISSGNYNKLEQISIDNTHNEIHVAKVISAKIFDMALAPSGENILSMFNSSELKKLTKAGEMKPYISVSPMLTLGIHVTRDSDIVLGIKEDGVSFRLTDTSCRKVVVFSTDGKQKRCYDKKRDYLQYHTESKQMKMTL